MACLLEKKNVFTFLWNIENVSMCPQKTGECLKSPSFVVDGLEKTTWFLSFYPRGEEDDEYVSVFLERCGLEQNLEKISVDYNLLLEFTCMPEMPSIPATTNEFEIGDAYGYPKCAKRSILLDGDVITVCCFMWIKYKNPNMGEILEDKEKSTEPNLSLEITSDLDSLKEMLCATNQDLSAFKCRFAPVECCARTHIKVQHMSIVCSLAKFCKDELNGKSYLPIMSAMNSPSFILTFEKDDVNEWVSIKIRMLSGNNSQHFVVGKITAFSSEKSSILFQKSEQLFEVGDEDDYWNFPSFIPVAAMSELSLHCELAISTLGEELITYESNRSVVERKCEKLNIESFSSCLGKNYGDLYKCPNLADVIITCEQQLFHVHKAVLVARSPVFKVLFEYKNLVEIEDLAPDVLHKIITYMYTDHLEDLKNANAFDLYPAAHKYQVEYLKRDCSYVLKSQLAVINVCDTLALADECHDLVLFSAAQNFIQNNAKEVFESSAWLKLSYSNLKLAFKISQSILKQKMNI